MEMIELATGPGGTVAVLTVMLITVYKLVVKHLIPLAGRYVDSVEERWREQMTEHMTDRDTYKMSMRNINARQDTFDLKADAIHADVMHVKQRIEEHILPPRAAVRLPDDPPTDG
jgi:hypothetical protein